MAQNFSPFELPNVVVNKSYVWSICGKINLLVVALCIAKGAPIQMQASGAAPVNLALP